MTQDQMRANNLLLFALLILIKKSGGSASISIDELIEVQNQESDQHQVLLIDDGVNITLKMVDANQLFVGTAKALKKVRDGLELTPEDQAFIAARDQRRRALHAEHSGYPN